MRDVHGIGHALAADEVLEEQIQIGREVGDGRGGHERVHRGVAVGTRVELPRVASNADRGYGRARARNGAGAAIRAKPDHDLVLVRAAGCGRKPEVVRDISNDAGAGVAIKDGYVSIMGSLSSKFLTCCPWS